MLCEAWACSHCVCFTMFSMLCKNISTSHCSCDILVFYIRWNHRRQSIKYTGELRRSIIAYEMQNLIATHKTIQGPQFKCWNSVWYTENFTLFRTFRMRRGLCYFYVNLCLKPCGQVNLCLCQFYTLIHEKYPLMT